MDATFCRSLQAANHVPAGEADLLLDSISQVEIRIE
jgi:hypothetical protein